MIAEAKGVWVRDVEGREFLDFPAGYEKGLIMPTAGGFGNVIRHLVPLVVADEQLEEGLKILHEAMAEKVE